VFGVGQNGGMHDDFVELHDIPGSCSWFSAERAFTFEQTVRVEGETTCIQRHVVI
jgi:hypothetical protein